jgi:periplasmic protein CpxP/Spy
MKGHAMDTSIKRRWFAGLAGLGGLGLLTSQVGAQGMGRHGGPGGHSPEEMAKHLDERMGRLIQEINGTPEQKDRLVKLAQTAMQDMKPLREQMRAARQKGMALLSATAIDRAALERLRQEQMSAAEALSRRMVQHMADAADVLTPAQRTQVAERMKQRAERGHGRWGHGGGWGGWWGSMGR